MTSPRIRTEPLTVEEIDNLEELLHSEAAMDGSISISTEFVYELLAHLPALLISARFHARALAIIAATGDLIERMEGP